MISSLPPPSSSTGDASIERRGSTDSHNKKDKKKKHHKDSKDKSSKKKVNAYFIFHISCFMFHVYIYTCFGDTASFSVTTGQLPVPTFIEWINGLGGEVNVCAIVGSP